VIVAGIRLRLEKVHRGHSEAVQRRRGFGFVAPDDGTGDAIGRIPGTSSGGGI
jgi:hypothetical protein